MAVYQILYWKDIPTQIKVFCEGRRPISRSLPERFLQEVDRRAMREGLAGSDEYLNQWRWSEKQERPGTPEELADALVLELEQTYFFS